MKKVFLLLTVCAVCANFSFAQCTTGASDVPSFPKSLNEIAGLAGAQPVVSVIHLGTSADGKKFGTARLITVDYVPNTNMPHIRAAAGPTYFDRIKFGKIDLSFTTGVMLGFENTQSSLTCIPWMHFKTQRFAGMLAYVPGERPTIIADIFYCPKWLNNERCEMQIGVLNHHDVVCGVFKYIDCESGIYGFIGAGASVAHNKSHESEDHTTTIPLSAKGGSWTNKLEYTAGIGMEMNW